MFFMFRVEFVDANNNCYYSQNMSKEKEVYVKDAEGFVCKKDLSDVQPDELVISEKEFKKISGLSKYNKN